MKQATDMRDVDCSRQGAIGYTQQVGAHMFFSHGVSMIVYNDNNI